MTPPRSLEARLAVTLGILLTFLWVTAAAVTSILLQYEMDDVFDSALQETAQRLLPLAVVDIVGREEDGVTQRLGAIRAHDELFTYIVRDAEGRILLQSHVADAHIFPAYDGPGFRTTSTHRIYNDDAVQGSIRITVAEPLDHRSAAASRTRIVLGLPILLVIPIAILAIFIAVRTSLEPLRRFRANLQARSSQDLSPVPAQGLPSEIEPVADTLNQVLERLKDAFDAERNFAANAAHELRTPLAGAIAQAQRLRSETAEPAVAERAEAIAISLKRLANTSERLMQLARAEGGRLRGEVPADLRAVLQVVVDEIASSVPNNRLLLFLPDLPVMSDFDPDAFAILARNLIDNALIHGTNVAPAEITLAQDGRFTVSNDCQVIPTEKLTRLTDRLVRYGGAIGSGLGLAIVASLSRRMDAPLQIQSPRPNSNRGIVVTICLPLVDKI